MVHCSLSSKPCLEAYRKTNGQNTTFMVLKLVSVLFSFAGCNLMRIEKLILLNLEEREQVLLLTLFAVKRKSVARNTRKKESFAEAVLNLSFISTKF